MVKLYFFKIKGQKKVLNNKKKKKIIARMLRMNPLNLRSGS